MMWALILFEILCILDISYCLKQRKFYKNHSTELIGTVIAWNKLRREDDKMNPVHYCLIVQAGTELYYVESSHSKARKYKEGKDVTILVVPHTPFPELPPETLARLNADALEAYEKARAADPKIAEFEKRLTILKDDLKRMGEVVFCIIVGLLFGILGVAAIVDSFV